MDAIDRGRHAGAVVLVTGGGSGIGLATALRFAREGAHVVACDIDETRTGALEAAFREAGADGVAMVADISTQAGVDAFVAAAVDRYGRVDVLANVAGVMDAFLPAHAVDDATWRRVMSVNIDGPMMLTRAVLPGMVERKAGAIVNVASVGGIRGGAAGAAYTASKHALVGLTRSVAWYYALDGVRCNAVCPGGVRTGIDSAPRDPAHLTGLAPIHQAGRRFAEPDEIASMISWLASVEAVNVNGAVIPTDGGWTAG
ncbi:MAG: SDR family oxidoreductase [Chloroflexi bacterium]|nr:SDR family oxidoreductase [Chloroflexota bacterium]